MPNIQENKLNNTNTNRKKNQINKIPQSLLTGKAVVVSEKRYFLLKNKEIKKV